MTQKDLEEATTKYLIDTLRADLAAAIARAERAEAEAARLRAANAVLRAACNVLYWNPTDWVSKEIRRRSRIARAAAAQEPRQFNILPTLPDVDGVHQVCVYGNSTVPDGDAQWCKCTGVCEARYLALRGGDADQEPRQ